MISKYWKWTLEEDFVIDLSRFNDGAYQYDDFSCEWIKIEDNVLTINAKYSFDGCSPKILLFGKYVVGTYDGSINPVTGKQQCYYASLVHDVLYQFCVPTRKHADKIFYLLLKRDGFKFADLYYRAVRLFGPRF